jgi:hypothetical protein
MKFAKTLLFLCCTQILLLAAAMNAQQAANSSTTAVMPQLVSFSGKAINDQRKPVVGIAGITCSIYKHQYDGAPLWMEMQHVNGVLLRLRSRQLQLASWGRLREQR